MNDIIKAIEAEQFKTDLPELTIGDTLRVNVKVVEGSRERIQTFEGYLISKKGGGLSETITVRRVSYGYRRGEDISGTFAQGGLDRGDTPWARTQGKALLSARQGRQSGQNKGKITFGTIDPASWTGAGFCI
jgi:hypothetical protein